MTNRRTSDSDNRGIKQHHKVSNADSDERNNLHSRVCRNSLCRSHTWFFHEKRPSNLVIACMIERTNWAERRTAPCNQQLGVSRSTLASISRHVPETTHCLPKTCFATARADMAFGQPA